MTKDDKKALQRSLNKFFDRLKLGYEHIKVDGVLGKKTKGRIALAKFYLGYGKKQQDGTVKSLFVRRLRHPKSPRWNPPGLLTRGAARRRKRRKAIKKSLQRRALHVAETLIGVMEHGGNNAGPMVSKIIRENGGMVGEPWCGDFVAYCYRHAGSKAVQRGWASTLQLGFLAGMSRTSKPIPGDIVVYDFPGGASSDHTGIFVKRTSGGIEAIEGNTGASGAVSDSATGGDGVYRKRRPNGQIARFVRVHR